MWGPKKEVVQRNRKLPCLLHHTADRRPDHHRVRTGFPWTSPRPERGQGAPSGAQNLLSFARGWGFRSSQFGALSHGDNAEQRPKGMLVGR